MYRQHVLVVVMLLAAVKGSEASDAMKFMVSGFMKVLEECKDELNTNDHLVTDLYHYWKQEYSFLHRETGCAIICMSNKLNLLDESGKLHHGNAKEFVKKHGAADDLAGKMIGVMHECQDKHEGILDDCSRILEVAKCFRSGIHDLQWEPNVDVIFTEILTDM